MVAVEEIKKEYNSFDLKIQMRLADTDNVGHLNNAAYIKFIETVRTEWQAFVMNGREFLNSGKWGWILGEIRIKFKKEAYLSDEIIVMMWSSKIGNKSWEFSYVLTNSKDDIIAIAQTSHVAYDYNNRKSILIPTNIKSDLEKRVGDRWDELN